jgi:hypothetical protein
MIFEMVPVFGSFAELIGPDGVVKAMAAATTGDVVLVVLVVLGAEESGA